MLLRSLALSSQEQRESPGFVAATLFVGSCWQVSQLPIKEKLHYIMLEVNVLTYHFNGRSPWCWIPPPLVEGLSCVGYSSIMLLLVFSKKKGCSFRCIKKTIICIVKHWVWLCVQLFVYSAVICSCSSLFQMEKHNGSWAQQTYVLCMVNGAISW